MNVPWPIWVGLATVGDAVLGPDLSIFGARPEMAAAAFCLFRIRAADGPDPLIAAWGLGLWRDCLSIGPAGVHAVCFLGVAVLFESMKQRWRVDTPSTRAAAIFASAALAGGGASILSGANAAAAAWGAVGGGIYTAVLASIVVEAVQRGAKWRTFGSRPQRA
jgi:rod shape-determining protein MreD